MITNTFLRKWIGILNARQLAEAADINIHTMNSKQKVSSHFGPEEMARIEQVLRRGGVRKRKRMSGQEINNSPIFKARAFVLKAGGNSKIQDDIYKGREVPEDIEKKFGEIVTEMAADIEKKFGEIVTEQEKTSQKT